MGKPTSLLDYWGKAGTEDEFHPLPYHSLDVAATGLEILQGLPRLRSQLECLSGLDSETFSGWFAFFLAVHDLGKFSSAFQQLRPELAPTQTQKYHYTVRHDTLGYMFWIRVCARDEELLGRLIDRGALEVEDVAEITETWVQCVTGHHGQPPKHYNDPIQAHFSEDDQQSARHWAYKAAELFLPSDPRPFALTFEQIVETSANLSWWLAGVCTLADWLGSNRNHFPYHVEAIPIDAYWNDFARPQAIHAVASSGILPVDTSNARAPETLFEYIRDFTPLQRACLECPIDNNGQLLILEDVTGAGKTEAAFILLSRIMRARAADGAYVALPTMATANAMYRRTAHVYRNLFKTGESLPSLVLAHGARHLDSGFRESIVADDLLPNESEYAPGEQDAEARCNSWLADNNKKSLLAQVGVGTIDQALLAVLKSRHQALRLLGLLGKVLIVDEVHASDAYMHRLLCELLRMHSSAGGSAILLSATLSHRMRQDLLRAWGASTTAARGSPFDYPLITSARKSIVVNQAVATRASVRRTLSFRLLDEESDAAGWLVQQAQAGQCVAWIRNTVDDAVRAWEAASRALGTENVILFHARFSLGDRLAIESHVLDEFGNSSNSDLRAGKVVIATQVIEQSLDLDFDAMVSDIAPIDLLIQRAGRLHRHARDRLGNRLADGEPDQRGPTTLHVLTPPPARSIDSRWIRNMLPGTGAVYPNHAHLWLTAHLLAERPSIRIPDDLREVIEYVFGEEASEEVPEALRESALRAEGQAGADASLARMNAISRSEGYRHSGSEWWDESRTPTRLGEPSTTVRLARWDGKMLVPWRQDQAYPWSFSEVRVRDSFLAEPRLHSDTLALAIKEVRAGWPRALRDTPLLALEQYGSGWYADAIDRNGKPIRFRYSSVRGLFRHAIEEMK